jgi:hypothetical protein
MRERRLLRQRVAVLSPQAGWHGSLGTAYSLVCEGSHQDPPLVHRVVANASVRRGFPQLPRGRPKQRSQRARRTGARHDDTGD